MIQGLIETPLSRIKVDGGDVMHGIKKIDPGFNGFGEAYFTWINPGAIKAWKNHSQMTMNLMVPVGQVRFVFIEHETELNPTFVEIEIGDSNYSRITVPPGIWFGFQGRGECPSLALNFSDIQHDPEEVSFLPLEEFHFDWNIS